MTYSPANSFRAVRARQQACVTMTAPKEPRTPSQSSPCHASGSPEPLFVDMHTPKFGRLMMDAPSDVLCEFLRERELIPSEEVGEGG